MFDPNTLNEEQLAAATFTDRDVLLAAGPGSGKTHTMTARIMYLTDKCGIDPSKILVITYTKDAATGMQKRFQSQSDFPMPVAFGTFHSVFYNMIREYKKPNMPVILYERNKKEIASNVIKKYLGWDYSKDESVTVDFIRAVSMYKNTLDEEKSAGLICEDFRSLFKDMFRYYENIRKKQNLMDFDDMVYDCRSLMLNDKAFKSKWKGRFTHILIDEFQDINQAQYETVKLLTDSKTNIFAVGDDDQAIYGFRGSKPSVLSLYLEERNAKLLHLNLNYRSDEPIVSTSLSVISENKSRIPKELRSYKNTKEGMILTQGFDNKPAEYAYILSLIKQCTNAVAVLFRTNLEMQAFAGFLASCNISYRIKESKTSLFEHFILKDICAYLKLVYSSPDEETLKEIINKPDRKVDVEYVMESGGNLNNITEIIKQYEDLPQNKPAIKKLYELQKDLTFMKSLSVSSSITYLYKKIGYERYVLSLTDDEDKKDEYKNILTKASAILAPAESFEEILLIKKRYEKSLSRSKTDNTVPCPDLMTAHASKGLEFNTVIIPDINEGNFPHGKLQDEETIEEERRLFYVAMTRAEERLYLLYLNGKENGKIIPSRFLTPILKNNTHKKENGLNQ